VFFVKNKKIHDSIFFAQTNLVLTPFAKKSYPQKILARKN